MTGENIGEGRFLILTFDGLAKSHARVIASASEAILFLEGSENTRLVRRPAKAELLAMTEYGLFTNASILIFDF